ncbi:NUDIX domain-containing protein [Nakamurella deserti]|uniref:NUDIX domain-containing protein n=1 Tax=Nakamurella deserti TaxID=2164074 RepID=UPI000DBE20A8|nr:NUDIX domain-containing protein [Nakamurella deserti]
MTGGSGDGWTTCAAGHRHWGLFGAAGLMVSTPTALLLQLRSPRTHHGDTWSVPGGARDRGEGVVAAALREAAEEMDVRPAEIAVWGEDVDDHGGWSYTTVLAHPRVPLRFRTNEETAAVRWVPLDEVATLPLHPGFRASWPRLAARLQAGPGATGDAGPVDRRPDRP